MTISDLNTPEPVEFFELRSYMRRDGKERYRIAICDPTTKETVFLIQMEDA